MATTPPDPAIPAAASTRRVATDAVRPPPEAPAGYELLRRLLPMLSRELRAPLNRIQSWSHVLENELARTLTQESGRNPPADPAPLTQHALAGIRNGIRDQLQLIDQLLDCSRAMDGSMLAERRPTLLLPLLEGVLTSAQLMAASKRIRVTAEYSASDARLSVDAGGLRSALMQLLSNAIKFSPDDRKVRLILRREQDHVLIIVADDGQGIRDDLLPALFDWFERGDSGQPGLGLGLALVRAYCEAEGGEVSARSGGVGCGASFTLRFPEVGTTH